MDRFLSRREVLRVTGLSHGTLYNYERSGVFPSRVQLGPNKVGWHASLVKDWMDSRPPSAIDAPPRRGNGLAAGRGEG